VTATANPPTLAAAEAAFAALHERLLTGDPGVTARAYAEARDAVDFASARQEAARRAEVQQAEEERRRRVEAAGARLVALDTADHDAARARLAEALAALAATCLDRAAALGEIVGQAGVSYEAGGRVTLGGVTRGPLAFQSAIRDLAEEATRRHFGPRQPFGLGGGNLPD